MRTVSEKARAAGLSGVDELAELTQTSRQTLNNWNNKYPRRFAAILAGAVELRGQESPKTTAEQAARESGKLGALKP